MRLAFRGKKLAGANLLDIPDISGILKYHLTKGLLAEGAPAGPGVESIAMNRLYNKLPSLEKVLGRL